MNNDNLQAATLIVDDELPVRMMLTTALEKKGYLVDSAGSVQEAIALMRRKSYNVVLTDLCMPETSGKEVLREARQLRPESFVVVMTAYGDIGTAVECMKLGASDFLPKPFSLDLLYQVVAQGLNHRIASFSERAEAPIRGHQFITSSPAMTEIMRLIKQAAPTTSTVLIRGESGTGKEMVARAIHQHSPRSARPFVALNCAAVPDHLLEDELFGHVRGAFTGADKLRIGRFEQANQGTLFLDEIGSMSLPLQAKLLRVLQEREFERLGSTTTIQCDVRIVAATNADLEMMVRRGEFREDLYYRLNVIPLTLPPLRDRLEDIAPLVEFFLEKFSAQFGTKPKLITPSALQQLREYHWPGNVRELQNAVERAVVLTGNRETIYPEDFATTVGRISRIAIPVAQIIPAEEMDAAELADYAELGQLEQELDGEINFENIVSEFERKLICQILKKTGGNKRKAAELLKLKRTTLGAKIRRLNLEGFAESA